VRVHGWAGGEGEALFLPRRRGRAAVSGAAELWSVRALAWGRATAHSGRRGRSARGDFRAVSGGACRCLPATWLQDWEANGERDGTCPSGGSAGSMNSVGG
jgi:hypothetical protein